MSEFWLSEKSKEKIDKHIIDVFIDSINFAMDLCTIDNQDSEENPLTQKHIECIIRNSKTVISHWYPPECIHDVEITFVGRMAKIQVDVDFEVIEKYLLSQNNGKPPSGSSITHENKPKKSKSKPKNTKPIITKPNYLN